VVGREWAASCPRGASRRALPRGLGDRPVSRQSGSSLRKILSGLSWRSCPHPATPLAALQLLFSSLLPGWRSCPQATPCWPAPVALEGCTEVPDCSDKAYPVTQAVCRRTAFAQRSACRCQFGRAQPAGLNVPLLRSPPWRKSATRVTVYSYTCTRLSFLNFLLIKNINFPGDGRDGTSGHAWLSLHVWL